LALAFRVTENMRERECSSPKHTSAEREIIEPRSGDLGKLQNDFRARQGGILSLHPDLPQNSSLIPNQAGTNLFFSALRLHLDNLVHQAKYRS
jgi:hypothetical protein